MCLHTIVIDPQNKSRMFVAISSAGATGAGTALGKALLGYRGAVRSICPISWPWDTRADMAKVACDSGMNLTPCAFKASKCRIEASSSSW